MSEWELLVWSVRFCIKRGADIGPPALLIAAVFAGTRRFDFKPHAERPWWIKGLSLGVGVAATQWLVWSIGEKVGLPLSAPEQTFAQVALLIGALGCLVAATRWFKWQWTRDNTVLSLRHPSRVGLAYLCFGAALGFVFFPLMFVYSAGLMQSWPLTARAPSPPR